MTNDKRYAVLIDADNISDKYIKIILDEISNYGVATYKRIYGDWTKSGLNSWKTVLLEHSVTPIQQYGYTTGKNATDSAMIIDAMDILYSGHVDGFCLVTSDSDFTRLAARMRESGMDVIGMGEKKTPKPFISACNKFKYLDVLATAEVIAEKELLEKVKIEPGTPQRRHGKFITVPNEEADADTRPIIYSPSPSTNEGDAVRESSSDAFKSMGNDPKILGSLEEIKKTVITLVEDNSDEDEWLYIGDLGNKLQKRYPDFDVRNFGFKKFTPFIKSFGLFELKTEKVAGTNSKLIYLKSK